MAKYIVKKSFRAEDVKKGERSPMRKKDSIVELSGKELEFAQDADLVKKYKEESK